MGTPQLTSPTVSIVIPTMNRPESLHKCLIHLSNQTLRAKEIIVVDSSLDNRSAEMIAADFPSVHYLRNSRGAGATATSRNIGLGEATGDIYATVDDDAFALPDWLEELCVQYVGPDIGGVGGRVRIGQPGEEKVGTDQIGRLREDGSLTGYFGAHPGRVVQVDHLAGGNMSFRRQVLLAIGGIRDGYPGTCLREETDLCLRVRAAGFKLLFTPEAIVDHVAAPHVRGSRFDNRYRYYAQRNHVVLLVRNFGFKSPYVRRYMGVTGRELAKEVRRAYEFVRDPDEQSDRSSRSRVRAVAAAGLHDMVIAGGTLAGFAAAWLEGVRDDMGSPRA